MRACLVLCLAGLLPAVHRADDPPPKEEVPAAMKKAVGKGVEYLKSVERDGNWEHLSTGLSLQYRGGISALAVLALLESGVKVDDPQMQRCLTYVRELPPSKTYAVALQTAVLAKAGLPQDKPQLEKHAAWLRSTAKTANGKIKGWSYPNLAAADNSNTQFAVFGLHMAAQAGVKVDEEVWQQIGEYFQRDQLQSGGWSYRDRNPQSERSTMVCAGVTCLSIVRHHLKNFPVEKAVDKGWKRLGDLQTVQPGKPIYFRFYNLYGMRRAGELTGRKTLEAPLGQRIAWYRVGVLELLRTQEQVGCWKGTDTYDGNAVLATSFAVLYLADGEKLLD